MKINWKNLNNIKLAKSGKYFIHKNGNKYYEFDSCPMCSNPYLGQKEGFCSRQCAIRNNERMMNNQGENNGFYGKKHSKKSKELNRQKHLGKSTKGYNQPNRYGKKNPNWKGGISKQRKHYRTKEYKNWRTSVFEKDDYKCWVCSKKGGNLQAHHIYEISRFPNKIYDVKNGITLCAKYHKSIRGKEKEFRRIYYETERNVSGRL